MYGKPTFLESPSPSTTIYMYQIDTFYITDGYAYNMYNYIYHRSVELQWQLSWLTQILWYWTWWFNLWKVGSVLLQQLLERNKLRMNVNSCWGKHTIHSWTLSLAVMPYHEILTMTASTCLVRMEICLYEAIEYQEKIYYIMLTAMW